jgi:hypothetical protein
MHTLVPEMYSICYYIDECQCIPMIFIPLWYMLIILCVIFRAQRGRSHTTLPPAVILSNGRLSTPTA